MSVGIGLIISGLVCVFVARPRRRRTVEHEIRVEPTHMCISCWDPTDPQRDFVTVSGEWYCKHCWKIKWEEENVR